MGRGVYHWDVGSIGRVAALVVLVVCAAGCAGFNPLAREYEYEEEIFLDTDGSASIFVNASIPALVTLRGLALDDAPDAEVDRDRLKALYESPATRVTRVSRPWRRDGRTFVQIRVEATDITALSEVAPFSWSRYTVERMPGESEGQVTLRYRQRVGAESDATSEAAANGAVLPQRSWGGDELIAIRLHAPSKISYHNAPSKRVERGNILSWEQPLRDRLEGDPIEIEVLMDGQSILYRTLAIFGATLLAAIALLASAAFWVKRKGRDPSKLFARRAS